MFYMLHAATGSNPCNGCPRWEKIGPECKAFQLCHWAYAKWKFEHDKEIASHGTPANVPSGHKFEGMSIKAIAAELGVSMNEVRRRKMAGTL
jgi:hypothetical protein